jgi:hypothetical protein
MFSKVAKIITQADINSLERVVNCCLPMDFANHYLSSNGGVSDKNCFYVEDDEGYVEVSFFLPIKYPSDNLGNMNIETTYENLISKGIPKDYLPFAVDWGGDYFSLNLKTNDIVLLLMDLGVFNENAVKYLTTGFSNFIDNLEEEGD